MRSLLLPKCEGPHSVRLFNKKFCKLTVLHRVSNIINLNSYKLLKRRKIRCNFTHVNWKLFLEWLALAMEAGGLASGRRPAAVVGGYSSHKVGGAGNLLWLLAKNHLCAKVDNAENLCMDWTAINPVNYVSEISSATTWEIPQTQADERERASCCGPRWYPQKSEYSYK